ncbi:MAG: histidine kinase [Betaproteobacteria bacterium]
MTPITASAELPHPAVEPPLRFVRRALRTLSWRQFGIAALLGATLGSVNGVAAVLAYLSNGWNNFLWGLVSGTALAVLLLPCLAFAACATAPRLPGWVVFAAAGAFGTAVTYVLVNVIFLPWLLGAGTEITLDRAWGGVPPFMLTGLFATLGYMHWHDAARSARILHERQLERVQFARRAYEARLVALQARIEPRFLFDTLADVETLYDRQPALGARVLDDLIVHLRAALPAIEESTSSLAVELELVRTWLDIMRIRSGDRLLVGMPAPEAPLDARMPPMVLLPLVRHAVEAGRDAVCAILVSAAANGDRILVTIVGPAAAFAPFDATPAVAQVRDRVAAIYGDLGTLSLKSALHDRSQAILEVPYERTDRRPR